MPGETHLTTLLKTMSPVMKDDPFVFMTAQMFDPDIQQKAIMLFREAEGMTAIVQAENARAKDQPQWAMITLTVHSDLSAVGFLAAITEKLAKQGISVNPVSAFYHDHLFVPWEKGDEAMQVLRSFQCS